MPLKWGELLKKVDFSDGTLTKNLDKLKNKGILLHSNKRYSIDDHMLSAWLKYKKNKMVSILNKKKLLENS